jgi:hypothetical protein
MSAPITWKEITATIHLPAEARESGKLREYLRRWYEKTRRDFQLRVYETL